MSIYIGEVETFRSVYPNKEQALKVLEEAAEVFGAWQDLDGFQRTIGSILPVGDDRPRIALLDECADVIQATANLVHAFGVTDMSSYMKDCEQRNRERGRI